MSQNNEGLDLPKLYPMTLDVQGKRTYQEYLDSMANLVEGIYCDYRIDWDDFHKLLNYAEARRKKMYTKEAISIPQSI